MLDPWDGKIPWRREWLYTSIFLPGESHGQRSLEGYMQSKESQRVRQDWTTNTCTSISVPGTVLETENIVMNKRKYQSSQNLSSLWVFSLNGHLKMWSYPSSHATFGKTLRTQQGRYKSSHFTDEENSLNVSLSGPRKDWTWWTL